MKTLGYYNGRYDLLENMSVPMLDRACYFGDGIYDVTYTRNYIPYCFDAHLDRFFKSAEAMRLKPKQSKAELAAILTELIRKLDSHEQIVYWQISRGSAERSHAFPDSEPNLWIMLRPMSVKDTKKPISAITVEDTRYFHCNIKTLNLIPNIMAQQKAIDAGCDTALFLRNGRVTEFIHANAQILKNGTVIMPPEDELILPGVARSNIIRIAGKLGIAVEQRPFMLDELIDADEIILSSSGSFCIPVNKLDGKVVGGKDASRLLSLQNALIEDFLNATAI